MSSTEYHGQNSELDAQIIEVLREGLDAMPVTLPPFAQVLERAHTGRGRPDSRRFPTMLAAAAAVVLLGALGGATAIVIHAGSVRPQGAQSRTSGTARSAAPDPTFAPTTPPTTSSPSPPTTAPATPAPATPAPATPAPATPPATAPPAAPAAPTAPRTPAPAAQPPSQAPATAPAAAPGSGPVTTASTPRPRPTRTPDCGLLGLFC